MKAIRPLTFITGVALLGLGGTLIARSLNRRSEPDGEENPNASVPYGSGIRIERRYTIDRPPAECYAAWRDLENLPTIMSHLRKVEILDERRSRWHAHGPGGAGASWEAELIDDTPGRRIAWRSVAGDTPNAGSVTFAPAPDDLATELRLEMEWAPPAGAIGTSFARLFENGDPGSIVERDLQRFKSMMEARASSKPVD